MTSAFLLLPHVGSVFSGWGAFAFAGLSCSAFFPMLVGFTASRNPAAISWIASMLTAAMMVGVGLGSYALGALRSVMPISALYTYAIAAPLGALSLVLVAALVRGGAFGRRGAPVSSGRATAAARQSL
jgi:predicted MFS family arabinose efflux permease